MDQPRVEPWPLSVVSETLTTRPILLHWKVIHFWLLKEYFLDYPYSKIRTDMEEEVKWKNDINKKVLWTSPDLNLDLHVQIQRL